MFDQSECSVSSSSTVTFLGRSTAGRMVQWFMHEHKHSNIAWTRPLANATVALCSNLLNSHAAGHLLCVVLHRAATETALHGDRRQRKPGDRRQETGEEEGKMKLIEGSDRRDAADKAGEEGKGGDGREAADQILWLTYPFHSPSE